MSKLIKTESIQLIPENTLHLSNAGSLVASVLNPAEPTLFQLIQCYCSAATDEIPGCSEQLTQKTRDVDPVLVQCRASVYDAGPTLNQHRVNASCVLGRHATVHLTLQPIPEAMLLWKQPSSGQFLLTWSMQTLTQELLIWDEMCARNPRCLRDNN